MNESVKKFGLMIKKGKKRQITDILLDSTQPCFAWLILDKIVSWKAWNAFHCVITLCAPLSLLNRFTQFHYLTFSKTEFGSLLPTAFTSSSQQSDLDILFFLLYPILVSYTSKWNLQLNTVRDKSAKRKIAEKVIQLLQSIMSQQVRQLEIITHFPAD